MKFNSRKSLGFKIVILATAILLPSTAIFSYFNTHSTFSTLFSAIICLGTSCFLLWIYFATFYKITGNELTYRSGPINGKILISQIIEIQTNASNFVGLKPAMAAKGLIVKYNRWDEIYLSPKREQDFIAELLIVNPAIKVGTK
ncbi:PH domain-containing protein [Pedobacter nototheniae]|uniref:PH domain-containing protein n=1 Tax=Pedobacter nototheniae TaxID=2488994 RepID=UPI0029301E25|nr:PH domain-containing protein [Pedobacter nototheniae]